VPVVFRAHCKCLPHASKIESLSDSCQLWVTMSSKDDPEDSRPPSKASAHMRHVDDITMTTTILSRTILLCHPPLLLKQRLSIMLLYLCRVPKTPRPIGKKKALDDHRQRLRREYWNKRKGYADGTNNPSIWHVILEYVDCIQRSARALVVLLARSIMFEVHQRRSLVDPSLSCSKANAITTNTREAISSSVFIIRGRHDR
jgi:hypothetical protein